MANVIAGCKAGEARLVFFDNIYMYGRVEGPITEDAPINPCSRKGEVRVRIADMVLREVREGSLQATIARAADFYGPYADTSSIPFLLCIKRLAAGKRAQVLVDARRKHSYTYTADCGKALLILAQSDEACGKVWHLPTAQPAPTGEEFIALVARELNVEPRIQVLRKWMVWLAGLFDRQTMELYEMLYQNEYDYEFDSTRFEQTYDFRPTSYEKGIAATIRHFREIGTI
jgi:nucleoside-diphosphate-sugar epimerase